MINFKFEHAGCNWLVDSSDDVFFNIYNDNLTTGSFIDVYENITLDLDVDNISDASDFYKDDLNYVISLIKNHIKSSKVVEQKKTSDLLSSLGVDVGIRRKYFDMDFRLYTKTKSLGLNMNQFINQAIIEKLEREGL